MNRRLEAAAARVSITASIVLAAVGAVQAVLRGLSVLACSLLTVAGVQRASYRDAALATG